ncbi:hypothetical protein DL89DRAFT_96133 [Linderina pennispora]|uniref:Uncharacterized protein n=1 Tax=Linderina pennispora TaxID=61395 RepID=A0A1Y1VRK1_9FUNG|nr:uncharacterized protein DL89DRAFT_96133 [Linderina pennispora]ORX63394.1 hypothetical protein DL89DRAFT_96133 [Linderina pennispora]
MIFPCRLLPVAGVTRLFPMLFSLLVIYSQPFSSKESMLVIHMIEESVKTAQNLPVQYLQPQGSMDFVL